MIKSRITRRKSFEAVPKDDPLRKELLEKHGITGVYLRMKEGTTLNKLEKGDPGVSLGNYATVLFVLGLLEPLSDLADPAAALTELIVAGMTTRQASALAGGNLIFRLLDGGED